ncbi:MAG: SagB/ThcOx family dehydrogenase [Gammaproteobacteria bacterium]|nr:MAG: SagB/ThcOx family dehydrogenase [Gammaproteobacteria bacterium]
MAKRSTSLITVAVVVSFATMALTFAWLRLTSGEEEADVYEKKTIGQRFHEETTLTWRKATAETLSFKINRPAQFKTYSDAETLALPKPSFQGPSFENVLQNRRSKRNYSTTPLTMVQLSQLLFAAQGSTGKSFNTLLRTSPSGGALYPFEIYPIVHNIEGLEPGIYHYDVRRHQLERLMTGDIRREITAAGLQQEMLGEAAVVFILTAIFDRSRFKYGERGLRYIYMEAGHISQNIALQATSLGLGSVPMGAFLDEAVNHLLGLDGEQEAAIYLHPVGVL